MRAARHGRAGRAAVVAATLAAIAAGLLSASQSPGAVDADFGDAPDGTSLLYPSRPGAVGVFPSQAASRGPSHASGALRLGGRFSRESSAR